MVKKWLGFMERLGCCVMDLLEAQIDGFLLRLMFLVVWSLWVVLVCCARTVISPLLLIRGLFWFAFLFLALAWVFPASPEVSKSFVLSFFVLFCRVNVEAAGFPVRW